MSAGADSSLINALLEAGTLDQTALPRAYHTPGRQATRDAEGDTETAPATAREEEALEWHEVIELQAFSERKAWIEEKIKFLEKLPPIQVFVGLDAVRTSAEEVPGLPSREQLQQWLAEHDKIEKETEGFDSGELKKLKKFTKAATQRNLSPADTDLIELTLTTIYELDKLLHLLRDRSDNLELLSLRLTWEERRTSAWVELRSIVEDLQNFLQTRGRWSPAVYDNFVEEDEEQDIEDSRTISPPIVKRKGSTVSLASSTSDSYSSSLILSRGERYKLAERLSRDAAQFASRVSSLKHSKINAAGKALDRLIDESRAPVPDELLDEQDKLEDKGIKEMEDIGKFVMSIVMQWKRADEMYAETVKDKSYAQTLLEEIEIALLHHPTSRQDSSFLARSTALTKRLEMRRDPSGTSNAFPRPRHPIFDDQRESNDHIAEVLTSELLSALDCARKVEVAMKEYHVNFEAVKKVEALCTVISDLYNRFESLTTQLEMGIENAAGDGNPPDLQNEHCLEPTSHHAFLSMVENILQELGRANEDADKLLQQARAALLDLKHPSIDAKFKADAADAVEMLEIRRRSALRSRDLITTRVAALHQLRGIWSNMARILDDLDNIRCDVAALTDVQMWKQQTQQNAALLTPESPTCPLPSSDLSPTVALEQLDALESRLHQMVLSPFATLSDSIGDDLQGYINNCCSGLSFNLEDARRMTRFWKSVQKQASEMEYVRDGTYALQLRVEDLKTQFDGSIRDALQGEASGCITPELDASLHDNLKQIQRDVQTYLDELPTRVSFVSQENSATSSSPPRLKRRFSVSAGLSLEAIQEAMFTAPSINPVELDRAVRADSNSYSMSLSGGLESLSKKADLYRLAQVACKIDASLVAPQHSLHQAEQALKSLQHVLEEQGDSLENLTLLSEQCDAVLAVHEPSIASVLTSARDLFECLHIGSTSHDPTSVASMLNPRRRAIEDVEEQFRAWKEDVEVFSERISDMQHLVQVKLAEKRIKDEEEKSAAAARAAQERLRVEAEAKADKARRDEKALKFVSKATVEEDVFGPQVLSSEGPGLTEELSELQARIFALRKRLQSMNMDKIARPNARGIAPLPSSDQATQLDQQFSSLMAEVDMLPSVLLETPSVETELQSLHSEVQISMEMMTKIRQLAAVATSIQNCDDTLSDLLEHVDSFPAPPAGPLASSYISDLFLVPEEQLLARLSFTRGMIDQLVSQCAMVADDSRVISERERILQTWDELEAMSMDRVNGRKSRPNSVLSSGRNSRASVTSSVVPTSRSASRKASYSKLSLGSAGGKFLAPPLPIISRRRMSGASDYSRSSSRASVASTTRSVSGPMDGTPTSSRLFTSTFASRQRSSSVTSNSPPALPSSTKQSTPKPRLPPVPGPRPRAQTGQSFRTASPALSETSMSRSSLNLSRSSTSRTSWARAPRQSFPAVPKASPPRPRDATERKPYIPDPKNQLDVAVGDVVNSLPVNINIEVVENTWRDQSGKYWIGDEDPKLCFCRILRSQTVMVRVGGGWSELSKFIKNHFADAFRLMPDSPPRARAPEENWISSATLSQAMQARRDDSPLPPRTPEPKSPTLPSFALSTPSATSSRSIDTSPGSPLRAIQFIRRADRDSPVMMRPDTPSKAPRVAASNTPRQPVWRP